MTGADLRIPHALRDRAQAIIDRSGAMCREHLDDDYALLSRRLVARLARKRPSPLVRGDVRIWAGGAIYALGQARSLPPELSQEARRRGLLPDLEVVPAA